MRTVAIVKIDEVVDEAEAEGVVEDLIVLKEIVKMAKVALNLVIAKITIHQIQKRKNGKSIILLNQQMTKTRCLEPLSRQE
jgi:hypothetical protein